jgi:hypothetical protein
MNEMYLFNVAVACFENDNSAWMKAVYGVIHKMNLAICWNNLLGKKYDD